MAIIEIERPKKQATDVKGGRHFPFIHFGKNQEVILDTHKKDSIDRAADDLAAGRVIIMNMSGVQGFVVDGSNEAAIGVVGVLKKRNVFQHPLVVGASLEVRNKIIDFTRMHLNYLPHTESSYNIKHFIEYPIVEGVIPEGIGERKSSVGRTAAIFWDNFYAPLYELEKALRRRNRKGFIAGSSANVHGQNPVRNAQEAYDVFGRNKGVSRILADSYLEATFPYGVSHTMLGFDQEGRVIPIRAGQITVRSFQSIYRRLHIPSDWKDHPLAQDVDLDSIRTQKTA